MSKPLRILKAPLVILLSVFLPRVLPAGQATDAKKPLAYSACDGWKSIGGTRLSRDGAWLVYALIPQDADGELVARNLATGAEYRVPRGKDPVITADGKFVAFAVAPSKADVDKAKKEKKKPEEMPKAGFGILDLASGAVKSFDRIKSFKVAEDGSGFVAYLKEAPEAGKDEKEEEAKKEEPKSGTDKKKEKKEKKKEPGTDLVVREFATGAEVSIAEVSEYGWNKPGTWLAFAVSSKTPANDGAFARKAAGGTHRELLKGNGNYKGLVFDEKGTQLAFVSDRDDYMSDAPVFKVYRWTETAPAAAELVPGAFKNIPAGMAPSENGKLEFSKDGARLFLGLAPPPKPEPEDAPPPVRVDIWSWKDPALQTMQKSGADQEKKRTYRAVVHLAAGPKKPPVFTPLASPDMPEIELPGDGATALGASNVPYRPLVSWDREYNDYYLVDLKTGARHKIIAKTPYAAGLSPAGRFVYYFDAGDKQWHTYRIADGKTFNLTAAFGVGLTDETWDMPQDAHPYGVAGWTAGDRSLLIYDRYDIWEVGADGTSPRMITAGAGRRDKIEFRYLRLDPEEKFIPSGTVLAAATFDETKATGIFRLAIEAPGKPRAGAPDRTGEPEKLVLWDKLFGDLIKAKNAEAYVFSLQRFDEFPDLWLSGPDFKDARKITDANPQQAGYRWGRADLIHYVNADGRTLPAVLIKPDDFDPSKRYPLMVYIYETLAETLHRYTPPRPGTGINFSRYVSNGYVILKPDIVYETGYPGECALKCVLPAVQKILAEGYIDPKRIGIQGHSWGGYQISYLITRTDIFAACEAGASVVDMISAYGGIRWGTGMSRAFQYEKTQSRIGGPPWERPLQYIENSPLFWVEKVRTPYLTIHDDEDDAVPWTQGIEFITALRRLGKEAYLFNFNGEKHGLTDRTNQKYWTVHLDEFFDHYLLGAPRPAWMDNGVPYLERGKRDIDALFK